MQILPIDITSVIAVIMGISIVLIPVIGITARFALKPTVEALAKVFESRGANESLQILERRLSLLEAQIESLEGSTKRLEEASDFQAQLQAGSPREALQKPEGGPNP
jgi:hypothetical protein